MCDIALRKEAREREKRSAITNNIVLQQCVESCFLVFPLLPLSFSRRIHDNEAGHLRSFSAVITRTCISIHKARIRNFVHFNDTNSGINIPRENARRINVNLPLYSREIDVQFLSVNEIKYQRAYRRTLEPSRKIAPYTQGCQQ